MADNKGLDALANLGTAFGLGATDQITGKDNLGQFVAGLEKRREKADAAARNASLLDSDISLGFINTGDIEKLGGRKALEGMTAEEFALQRDNLRQAAAQEKGDENVLAEAQRRVIASGRVTPEEASGMTLDQLAEAEGAYLETEKAQQRAVTDTNDMLGALGTELAAISNLAEVGDDQVLQAESLLLAAEDKIANSPNLRDDVRATARQNLAAYRTQVEGLRQEAEAQRVTAEMSDNPAGALVSYNSLPEPTKARVQKTEGFQALNRVGSEAKALLDSITPEELAELDSDARALYEELLADGELSAAPTWENLARTNAELAASIGQMNLEPLRKGLTEAREVLTKLRPAQATARQALTNIRTQDPETYRILGVNMRDVDELTLDAAGNITGQTDMLLEARSRLAQNNYSTEDLVRLVEAGDLGFFQDIDPKFPEYARAALERRLNTVSPAEAEMARVDVKESNYENALATTTTIIESYKTVINSRTFDPKTATPEERERVRKLRETPLTFTYTHPPLRRAVLGDPDEGSRIAARVAELQRIIASPDTQQAAQLPMFQLELQNLEGRALAVSVRDETSLILANLVQVLAADSFDQAAVRATVTGYVKSRPSFQGSSPRGLDRFNRNTGPEATEQTNVDETITFVLANVGEIVEGDRQASASQKNAMRQEIVRMLQNYQDAATLIERELDANFIRAQDLGPGYTEASKATQVLAQLLGE